MQDTTGESGAPVRVVRLQIPNHMLSESLFGQGIAVTACQVVFRHMLPAPPEATLHAVLDHGLVIVFPPAPAAGPQDEPPTGLLVPWSQLAYVKFIHAG